MITLAEAREAANIEASNTDYDVSFLTPLIANITARINSWCGQPILETSTTVEFEGDNSQEIILKKFPIKEITSLKYRDSPLDDWVTIPDTEYAEFKKDDLDYLFYDGYFSAKYYQLTYISGRVATPDDVKGVVKEMVAWAWTESPYSSDKSLTIISKSISEGGQTVNYSYMKDWKTDWTRILGKYRTYLL